MLVSDYLNAKRDEMIARLREAQDEALRQLEIIRNNSKLAQDNVDESILRKMFSRIIRMPFILYIEETTIGKEKKLNNPSPFKMYLIQIEFNIENEESFFDILGYIYLFNF